MIAQIIGAVLNIILDPILIFGYFGLPSMGIKGAAYATIIGQIVSLIASMIFHHKYNKEIESKAIYFKPKRSLIIEIYKVGIPAIMMQALMSFMTYGVHIIFGRVSSAAVTAYGVYYKIQQFVFFAAFGLNNALIPIIAFNYGKKDKKRAKDGIKYGIIYTLIIMFIGAVGLQLLAGPLISIFALSEETQVLGIMAIRIITLGYMFAGANIAFQGIFQAFGSGIRSLAVSMIRLIIITLSNARILIWWAFPIAEGCGLIIALFLMKGVSKDKLALLNALPEKEGMYEAKGGIQHG